MSRKASLDEWMQGDPLDLDFGMIPHSLLTSQAFQNLSAPAQLFYIKLNVHKRTSIQRDCLCNVLEEYNEIYSLGMSKEKILAEAKPNKHSAAYSSGLFVIPSSHLKMYGYTDQYAYKLKKELIDAGFIKVKYAGKGKSTGWRRNITVYQFIEDWKKMQ